MNPRFDLFRKQNACFIKWVGTAESLEDLEKLIRADSGGASQDDYVVVRSGYGVTEVLTKAVTEKS
jgi:hypothetical protein